MSENDGLIIYPVPSLVATLLNRERTKGSPLTEEEVIQIRDTCPAIAMPPDVARQWMSHEAISILIQKIAGKNGNEFGRNWPKVKACAEFAL